MKCSSPLSSLPFFWKGLYRFCLNHVFFINRFQGKSLKEVIAFGVSAAVCWYWDFDALSMILLKDSVTLYGAIITGGVVAGGSKASVKLFRDILQFKSTAEARRQEDVQKGNG